MRATYFIHIAAGCLSILFGYVALYSSKGAPLHRRSGLLFVYTMLPMALFGMTISVVRGVAPAVNVPAGLLTTYLVITSLAALRPSVPNSRWLLGAAMLVALAVGLANLSFALEAFANGGKREGIPAFPFVMFGVVGVLAGAGDLRVIRNGALKGTARLARHLWRMCFALFIAAISFFIGQAQVIPKPIRIMPLLAFPVLAVLLTMFYWLWRVRRRGGAPIAHGLKSRSMHAASLVHELRGEAAPRA